MSIFAGLAKAALPVDGPLKPVRLNKVLKTDGEFKYGSQVLNPEPRISIANKR